VQRRCWRGEGGGTESDFCAEKGAQCEAGNAEACAVYEQECSAVAGGGEGGGTESDFCAEKGAQCEAGNAEACGGVRTGVQQHGRGLDRAGAGEPVVNDRQRARERHGSSGSAVAFACANA